MNMGTKIIKIGWISIFLRKKLPKVLSVSKKALPLRPQSREMASNCGIFEQAECRNLFMPRRRQKCRLFEEKAEIAQLVEHNLAKVGVAGPSPVFRSTHFETKERFCNWCLINAQVAELVDAHVSGACAARRAGSIPVLGTHNSECFYMLERWRNW